MYTVPDFTFSARENVYCLVFHRTSIRLGRRALGLR